MNLVRLDRILFSFLPERCSKLRLSWMEFGIFLFSADIQMSDPSRGFCTLSRTQNKFFKSCYFYRHGYRAQGTRSYNMLKRFLKSKTLFLFLFQRFNLSQCCSLLYFVKQLKQSNFSCLKVFLSFKFFWRSKEEDWKVKLHVTLGFQMADLSRLQTLTAPPLEKHSMENVLPQLFSSFHVK